MSRASRMAAELRTRGKGAARGVPFYALGVLLALGLKEFYARAGADDLGWILAPTTGLAGLLSGIRFEHEAGAGWISHAHHMIVGPACAGLNFLIIAFSTLFFSFLHRLDRPASRALWLAVSLAAAFLLAIVTNAIRIVAAIFLHDQDVHGVLLCPAGVHRLEGVIVYLASLLLAYLTVERLFDRFRGAAPGRGLPSAFVPLSWYAAIALGVPLLHRGYGHDGGRFLEHAGVVLAVCAVMALIAFAIGRLARRPAPGPRKHETATPGC